MILAFHAERGLGPPTGMLSISRRESRALWGLRRSLRHLAAAPVHRSSVRRAVYAVRPLSEAVPLWRPHVVRRRRAGRECSDGRHVGSTVRRAGRPRLCGQRVPGLRRLRDRMSRGGDVVRSAPKYDDAALERRGPALASVPTWTGTVGIRRKGPAFRIGECRACAAKYAVHDANIKELAF